MTEYEPGQCDDRHHQCASRGRWSTAPGLSEHLERLRRRQPPVVEALDEPEGEHTEPQHGQRRADAIANALLQITAAEERGTPLSPARLSESLPLSSDATTALLNRLEGAGHIIRTREHDDRRIVTLRSSEHFQERFDAFFRPLGERLDAMMAAYPPELLAQFDALVGELSRAMDAQLDLHERDG